MTIRPSSPSQLNWIAGKYDVAKWRDCFLMPFLAIQLIIWVALAMIPQLASWFQQ